MVRSRLSLRVLLTALLALLGAVSVATAAPPRGWVQVDSFKIGVVNHITGPTALSGQLRKNGYELGLEEVNRDGGINGLPVELVYEDDQGTNPGAVAATRRLLSQNDVVAILIDRSTMVNAVHPIILEEAVPTLFGASAWSISELRNPWFFRMRLNDRDTAAIMAKFIVEELGKTRIAGLHDADTFGEGGNKETQAYLKAQYGLTPVTVQKYTSGTKDYTAQLLAIKASSAEVVYAWGTNSEDNAIILRQLRQLGLEVDFVGSAAYGSAVTLDIAGENANGIYTVYDFAFEDERPELQAWLSAYRSKYNADPDFWSLNTYDAVKLVADAARRAGIVMQEGGKFYMMPLSEAREALAEALRATVNYRGAQGDYWADEYQNMIHSMAVLRIENGRPRLVKVIELDK